MLCKRLLCDMLSWQPCTIKYFTMQSRTFKRLKDLSQHNWNFFLLVKWCLLTHNVNTFMKPIRYLTPYSSTDFVVQHMSLNCKVKKHNNKWKRVLPVTPLKFCSSLCTFCPYANRWRSKRSVLSDNLLNQNSLCRNFIKSCPVFY